MDSFEGSNSFRAMVGQRGLNPREVVDKIRELTSGLPEDAVVSLRINIGKEKRYELVLKGMTASYLVLSALTDRPRGSVVTDADVEAVLARSPETWEGYSNYRSGETVRRLIRGVLRSMHYVVD